MKTLRGRLSPFQKRIVSALILIPLAGAVALAGEWFFRLLILALFALSLREWVRFSLEGPSPARDVASGIIYLLPCFVAFVWIHDFLPSGPWLALSLVMSVAASDIGAYVAGRTIGGPKLAPSISPNKTWAGFGGAMGFCAASLAIFYALSPIFSIAPPEVPGGVFSVFAFGLLLGISGQAGDLFISIRKRRCGRKDSGTLIPGHGGILDRIDSHLLAAPVFLLCAWIVGI